jgi:hypothetical protein
MKLLLLLSPLLLWFLPLCTYRRLRAAAPIQVWRWTGIATGIVVCPASIGVYALYWVAGYLWVFGFPLALVGMLGLLVGMIHGDPVYALATILGIVAPGIVVHGAVQVFIALLGAFVWAPVYGALGWGIDLWRQRRLHPWNAA